MEDLLARLNEKNNDILNAKTLLKNTDWEVIKASELGIDLDANIKNARAEARGIINQIEIEIIELKQSIENYDTNQD